MGFVFLNLAPIWQKSEQETVVTLAHADFCLQVRVRVIPKFHLRFDSRYRKGGNKDKDEVSESEMSRVGDRHFKVEMSMQEEENPPPPTTASSLTTSQSIAVLLNSDADDRAPATIGTFFLSNLQITDLPPMPTDQFLDEIFSFTIGSLGIMPNTGLAGGLTKVNKWTLACQHGLDSRDRSLNPNSVEYWIDGLSHQPDQKYLDEFLTKLCSETEEWIDEFSPNGVPWIVQKIAELVGGELDSGGVHFVTTLIRCLVHLMRDLDGMNNCLKFPHLINILMLCLYLPELPNSSKALILRAFTVFGTIPAGNKLLFDAVEYLRDTYELTDGGHIFFLLDLMDTDGDIEIRPLCLMFINALCSSPSLMRRVKLREELTNFQFETLMTRFLGEASEDKVTLDPNTERVLQFHYEVYQHGQRMDMHELTLNRRKTVSNLNLLNPYDLANEIILRAAPTNTIFLVHTIMDELKILISENPKMLTVVEKFASDLSALSHGRAASLLLRTASVKDNLGRLLLENKKLRRAECVYQLLRNQLVEENQVLKALMSDPTLPLSGIDPQKESGDGLSLDDILNEHAKDAQIMGNQHQQLLTKQSIAKYRRPSKSRGTAITKDSAPSLFTKKTRDKATNLLPDISSLPEIRESSPLSGKSEDDSNGPDDRCVVSIETVPDGKPEKHTSGDKSPTLDKSVERRGDKSPTSQKSIIKTGGGGEKSPSLDKTNDKDKHDNKDKDNKNSEKPEKQNPEKLCTSPPEKLNLPSLKSSTEKRSSLDHPNSDRSDRSGRGGSSDRSEGGDSHERPHSDRTDRDKIGRQKSLDRPPLSDRPDSTRGLQGSAKLTKPEERFRPADKLPRSKSNDRGLSESPHEKLSRTKSTEKADFRLAQSEKNNPTQNPMEKDKLYTISKSSEKIMDAIENSKLSEPEIKSPKPEKATNKPQGKVGENLESKVSLLSLLTVNTAKRQDLNITLNIKSHRRRSVSLDATHSDVSPIPSPGRKPKERKTGSAGDHDELDSKRRTDDSSQNSPSTLLDSSDSENSFESGVKSDRGDKKKTFVKNIHRIDTQDLMETRAQQRIKAFSTTQQCSDLLDEADELMDELDRSRVKPKEVGTLLEPTKRRRSPDRRDKKSKDGMTPLKKSTKQTNIMKGPPPKKSIYYTTHEEINLIKQELFQELIASKDLPMPTEKGFQLPQICEYKEPIPPLPKPPSSPGSKLSNPTEMHGPTSTTESQSSDASEGKRGSDPNKKARSPKKRANNSLRHEDDGGGTLQISGKNSLLDALQKISEDESSGHEGQPTPPEMKMIDLGWQPIPKCYLDKTVFCNTLGKQHGITIDITHLSIAAKDFSAPPRPKEISLIHPLSASLLTAVLESKKNNYTAIIDAVKNLEFTELNSTIVKGLTKWSPSQYELQNFHIHTKQGEDAPPIDLPTRLAKSLARIPNLKVRFKYIRFLYRYMARTTKIKLGLQTTNRAIKCLNGTTNFKALFHLILQIGLQLSSNHWWLSFALGFKLSSLPLLQTITGVSETHGQICLLDFIVDLVQKSKYPSIVDFKKLTDLNITSASSFDIYHQELKKLTKSYEKLEALVKSCPDDSSLATQLKPDQKLSQVREEIPNILNSIENSQQTFNNLVLFYGEDVEHTTIYGFFSHFTGFMNAINLSKSFLLQQSPKPPIYKYFNPTELQTRSQDKLVPSLIPPAVNIDDLFLRLQTYLNNLPDLTAIGPEGGPRRDKDIKKPARSRDRQTIKFG